ncbi:hydrolase [Ectobacillus antri]|uniref:Hydrolase n=1 Tax=Ectobacillus antri TaxID=2486280 RepID=A0ABT6H4D2_9BACI|nr:hydrolase [Ectobacillus antri]MDG4656435.1 hydrolase [Ectobacillus antri]MDG5753485.1 hydrolase [Ectobacillus antri]
MMEKQTYYISVGEGSISRSKTANTYSFEIQATDEEIIRLRQLFDSAYVEDIRSFWRSHIPFLEYHHDHANDKYDARLQEAYRMIYELGDGEAKELIAQMGIIDGL